MAIDVTKRKITKINREVSRLTAKVIKNREIPMLSAVFYGF